MATPRGAEHRDLEQRLRRLEQRLQELTSRALRREQLAVTQGDFVVSGGGNIEVQDGGELLTRYPAGGYSLRMFPNALGGADLMVLDVGGSSLFNVSSGDGTYSSAGTQVDTLTLNANDVAQLGTINGGPAVLVYPDSRGVEVANGDLTAAQGALRGQELYMDNPPITSEPANVNISSIGRLRKVTSSRRFKENIRDAEVDVDAALALRPRVFTRNDEDPAEVDPADERPEYVGFIAEEADELGLDAWVEHDEAGPFAFAYSNWCVALQAIARRQQQQLDDQADQLTELQARLAELEDKLTG